MIRVVQLILLCFALAVPNFASSQNTKIPVSVDHSGSDTVGQRLAYAVRETIRGSNGYRLASGRDAVLRISLITLDPERTPSNAGYWTAAAVGYTMRNDLPLDRSDPQTFYPIHLTTSIVTAGTSRVDEQAKSIVATLDTQVEQYLKDMRSTK